MIHRSVICVDPGLRRCGVALFRPEGTLEHAFLATNPVQAERGPKAWREMAQEVSRQARWRGLGIMTALKRDLILEVPQVYAGSKAIGDPADLIELAGVDGAIAAEMAAWAVGVTGIHPHAWKGNVPPDTLCERVEAALQQHEIDKIHRCAKSLRHNVLDAIGIGLHHFGRLHVRGIHRGAVQPPPAAGSS